MSFSLAGAPKLGGNRGRNPPIGGFDDALGLGSALDGALTDKKSSKPPRPPKTAGGSSSSNQYSRVTSKSPPGSNAGDDDVISSLLNKQSEEERIRKEIEMSQRELQEKEERLNRESHAREQEDMERAISKRASVNLSPKLKSKEMDDDDFDKFLSSVEKSHDAPPAHDDSADSAHTQPITFTAPAQSTRRDASLPPVLAPTNPPSTQPVEESNNLRGRPSQTFESRRRRDAPVQPSKQQISKEESDDILGMLDLNSKTGQSPPKPVDSSAISSSLPSKRASLATTVPNERSAQGTLGGGEMASTVDVGNSNLFSAPDLPSTQGGVSQISAGPRGGRRASAQSAFTIPENGTVLYIVNREIVDR